MTMRKIHTVSDRQRGWETFSPVITDRKLDAALELLVKYELGFGGQIIEVEPTRVAVRTNVLGCVDTTTFTASASDLKPLVDVAEFYVLAIKDAATPLLNATYDALVASGIPTSAFVCKNFAPLLFGEQLSKLIMIHLLKLPRLKKLPDLSDLCSAYALMFEGCSTEEVHSLLN